MLLQYILGDTADGGVWFLHADVGDVVQLAEDAQLRELGDAGEKDKA